MTTHYFAHRRVKSMDCNRKIKLNYTSEEERAELETLGKIKISRYFAIEAKWYSGWINHMEGGPDPGPIGTSSLISYGRPKTNLQYGLDYCILNLQQWIFLHAKYGSEHPLELLHPYVDTTFTDNCCVAHFLSTPVTERSELNIIAPARSQEFHSNNNSVSLPLSENLSIDFGNKNFLQKKFVFCIQLPEKYDSVMAELNALLSIKNICQFFIKKKGGVLTKIIGGLVTMILNKNYAIVKSVKLVEYLDEYFPNPQASFFDYLFLKVDEETQLPFFQTLSSVTFHTTYTCPSCQDSNTYENIFTSLNIEAHKSIQAGITFFSEPIQSKSKCKQCKNPLIKKAELVSTGQLLIVNIRRFREIPYKYKVSTHTRISKNQEICGRKYTLSAVITHEGDAEAGKYLCYCKRGKSWYICCENGVFRAALADVLKKVALKLVYFENE